MPNEHEVLKAKFNGANVVALKEPPYFLLLLCQTLSHEKWNNARGVDYYDENMSIDPLKSERSRFCFSAIFLVSQSNFPIEYNAVRSIYANT